MLLNVHVTPGVLAETSRSEARFAAPALRKEIQDLLLRHGVLRFASKEEATRWLDSLKLDELSPQETKEWQVLLLALNKQGRMVAESPALVENPEIAATADELEPLKALAPVLSIVGTETYQRVFPNAEVGVSKLAANAEVTVPGSISQSSLYENLTHLVESGRYPAGTGRTRVWESLFAPLASVSKEIVIFDKYLFGQLDVTSDEHVNWLLAQLDATAPAGASVKLIGARGVPDSYGNERVPGNAADAEWLLREYLPGKFTNLRSVEAILAPSVRARDMHHDRHIRFSAGAAVELPAGFDRLGTPQLRDTFSFTYRHLAGSLTELAGREESARKRSGTHVFSLT